LTELLTSSSDFVPTDGQRRLKTAFWATYEGDKQNVSMAAVLAETDNSSITNWWSKPGFQSWFKNRDEGRQRLEYLFFKALDCLEDILKDTDPKTASARVNAVKAIAELANKIPSKYQTDKLADADINKMNRQQLESYLKKNKHILKLLSAEDEVQIETA